MSTNFNLEVQSEHFGNGRSFSIEGCNVEIIDKNLNSSCKFHYHFLNDSRQDASTTNSCMTYKLEELNNKIS